MASERDALDAGNDILWKRVLSQPTLAPGGREALRGEGTRRGARPPTGPPATNRPPRAMRHTGLTPQTPKTLFLFMHDCFLDGGKFVLVKHSGPPRTRDRKWAMRGLLVKIWTNNVPCWHGEPRPFSLWHPQASPASTRRCLLSLELRISSSPNSGKYQNARISRSMNLFVLPMPSAHPTHRHTPSTIRWSISVPERRPHEVLLCGPMFSTMLPNPVKELTSWPNPARLRVTIGASSAQFPPTSNDFGQVWRRVDPDQGPTPPKPSDMEAHQSRPPDRDDANRRCRCPWSS